MDTVRFVSFWLAIWMPMLYVPFLLSGIDTSSELLTFLVLLVLHLFVLFVGRSHQPR